MIEVHVWEPGQILIREYDHPAVIVVTSRRNFALFLTSAKAGDLDHLIELPQPWPAPPVPPLLDPQRDDPDPT
jgi:hypothetical protein